MLRATCVALVLLAVPAGARTDGRLAIVDVSTPPSMMGLGGQVTQALIRAAQEQGYTLIPPDLIRARLGEKEYAELQKCNGAVACVAGKLGELGANRAVVGTLGRDDKAYLLRLWLIDLSTRKVIADVDRSILIATRRFNQDTAEAIPRLLRGEKEARGTLKLTSTVKHAKVSLDGESVGEAPLSLQVKPGKHQVRMEKKSYLAVDRLVAVEADQETSEEFRLLLAPGQKAPEDEDAGPKAVAQVTASSQGGELPRIPVIGWVGYGVALAAAGGAAYFGNTSRTLQVKLQEGHDAVADTYHGTRAEALTGKQDALVANILFGVAGAALGTAVTLTILENRGGPAVQVTPTAGPGGAGVRLEGRF